MSSARYCVTMTQHHSHIGSAAQGTHRRAKLVWQNEISLSHSTCILNSASFIALYLRLQQRKAEQIWAFYFLTSAEERENSRMHALLLFLCCSGHVGYCWESFSEGKWRTEHQSLWSIHVDEKPCCNDTSTPVLGYVTWTWKRWASDHIAYITKTHVTSF